MPIVAEPFVNAAPWLRAVAYAVGACVISCVVDFAAVRRVVRSPSKVAVCMHLIPSRVSRAGPTKRSLLCDARILQRLALVDGVG